MKKVEALFAPPEFAALKQRDLSDTVCVVFDILRATTTMIAALGNGATRIVPVEDISEAVAWRRKNPAILLAGERDGLRISGNLAQGVEFDLGNSPREFTKNVVQEKTIVITTTNGTRALRACAQSRIVLAGSFLNLRATADFVMKTDVPHLLVVGSGTYEEASYEDALAAGALYELLEPGCRGAVISDSVLMARELFRYAQKDLLAAFSRSRNGRRLLSLPDLRDDVAFCAQRDVLGFTAELRNGELKRGRDF